MEFRLNNSSAIRDFNSYPVLFKSMKNISLDNYFDNEKMVFTKFDSTNLIFETEQEKQKYFIFSKSDELERIKNLFSNTINNVCAEYYEGKLDVNLVFEILDRIESHFPDAKVALENLGKKVPQLSKNIDEFILQHKLSMRMANKLFDDRNQSLNNDSLHVLNQSIFVLKSELIVNSEEQSKIRQSIQVHEEDLIVIKEQLRLCRSTIGLSRTVAKEALNLTDVKAEVADSALIDHLEEHNTIHSFNELLHRAIEVLKSPTELTQKYEQTTKQIEELNEQLLNLRNLSLEKSSQLKQKEEEKKSIQ